MRQQKNDVETAFTSVILQKAKLIEPSRECRLPGRGWIGGSQAEAEISIAMTVRQDSQLKRAVRRENTHVHRACDAAYESFL